MNKLIVFAFCGCLFFSNGFSQNKNIEGLLIEIEQNNTALKGYQFFIKSQQLKNKSANNLPNPQLSGYYLPFGDNATGAYTEYQVAQSIEFPTVYSARGKWNDLKSKQLQNVFAKKRQEVLLKAKELFIELHYLQKQKVIETQRKIQIKRVLDQVQELFNKGQVGILDLNKSKIAWAQEQFIVEQINNDIQILLSKLKTLNGDNPLGAFSTEAIVSSEITTLENLWQEKLVKDPFLKELKTNEKVSFQKITLEKNKMLPDLTFGFNNQGVNGDNYSGFYGGISIPLWNSKNKVKAAKATYEYQQSNTKVITGSLYSQFQESFNNYQLMLSMYNEYQITMNNLESEDLLFKAYMLGEYSFMNYYMELQFYRNASDKALIMEKKMQILKAQLLKHQL